MERHILDMKQIKKLEKLGIKGACYLAVPVDPNKAVEVLNIKNESIGQITLAQAFKL